MTQQASDFDIISAVRKGDGKALSKIFQLYWKPLYNVALRKTNSHEIAEEMVQDLFTDLWDKRATLFVHQQPAYFNLSTYLMTAIKNKVLNHIRSQVYQSEYFDYYKSVFSSLEKSTERQVEFKQLQEALDEGVERLPDRAKQVFTLSRLEGRTIPEIAHTLNLSEKTIEYHLTKSLKAIRIRLKDYILFFLGFTVYYVG